MDAKIQIKFVNELFFFAYNRCNTDATHRVSHPALCILEFSIDSRRTTKRDSNTHDVPLSLARRWTSAVLIRQYAGGRHKVGHFMPTTYVLDWPLHNNLPIHLTIHLSNCPTVYGIHRSIHPLISSMNHEWRKPSVFFPFFLSNSAIEREIVDWCCVTRKSVPSKRCPPVPGFQMKRDVCHTCKSIRK